MLGVNWMGFPLHLLNGGFARRSEARTTRCCPKSGELMEYEMTLPGPILQIPLGTGHSRLSRREHLVIKVVKHYADGVPSKVESRFGSLHGLIPELNNISSIDIHNYVCPIR
jgi:hypothetical protein